MAMRRFIRYGITGRKARYAPARRAKNLRRAERREQSASTALIRNRIIGGIILVSGLSIYLFHFAK